MFTVNREDFKSIHNGIVYLRMAIDRLEDTLHGDMLKELRKAKDDLVRGTSSLYSQDENWFNTQHSYFDLVKSQSKFSSSWSMYEVQNMNLLSPYNHTRLKYDGHEVAIERESGGDCARWIDLWRAADNVMMKSQDRHHVFIEAFYTSAEESDCLFLSTGS